MLAVIMLWHVGMAAGNDVYIVGYNDYGQLGLGDYLERSTQTLMRDLPLDVARSAAAGLYHNLIVGVKDRQVGTVYSWGRNTKGQLGHGNVESIKLPKQVEWKACPEPNSWVCSPALCKIARDAGQDVPEWLAKYEKGKESKQWKVADAVLKT